ncbi:MAG TPA: amino acid permease [Planctomycetota bacterium]|nr:amino acid permease [Planctomycetota bacterium]
MSDPAPPPQNRAGPPTGVSAGDHLRQLSPLLVWAVVFADIGTSVYYVPGVLYRQVGEFAPLFVILGLFGFVLLAHKYVEICWRKPDGGGVVSIASEAFTPRVGLVGGLLISVSYFLTSAISTVSGVRYIASIPDVSTFFDEHVLVLSIALLVLLAVINIIGIRESALLSFFIALCALGVNLIVAVVSLWKADAPSFAHMKEHLVDFAGLDREKFLIGFAGAWLAFSGLESISQLSPAMKLPLKRTATRGMLYVVITIVITSPILTLLAISMLPMEIKAGDVTSTRLISELGSVMGGYPLMLAVVATGASLLLFASNTAIIGGYHVFLALVDQGFLPAKLAARNHRFKTPHVAVITATVLPILVILILRSNLDALAHLYAFGLLGAFLLSSAGVDALRWREGVRGWRLWLGMFTTVLILTAWLVNMFVQEEATVAGIVLVGVGLLLAVGTQQRWFSDLFYMHPAVKRRAERMIAESEHGLETEKTAEILSLAQAEAIAVLYPSHTLVAIRSSSPGVVQEAMTRERGSGGKTLYAIYVEERTGLFVGASEYEPDEEGMSALRSAVQLGEREGIEVIPIWTVSHNAVEGIARAAESLGVNALVIGASQRHAIYHLLRGHVVAGLTRQLPSHIRLVLCT